MPDFESHDPDDLAFENARSRLFAVAYGVLGQVMDAEDIVQEAWLRWRLADRSTVAEPLAYLTTIVTRLALDRLRAAVRWREEYVGPWLPEPIVVAADPGDVVADAEQISLAFLATLERLSPIERVVLVLREVFDLEYGEIAEAIEKTAVNCRKIYQRARDHVGDETRVGSLAGPTADPVKVESLFANFLLALNNGDTSLLMEVLAPEAVLVADGGPNRHAARRPVLGPERIARFLVNIAKRSEPGDTFAITTANRDPAIVYMRNGEPDFVMSIDVVDEHIIGVRSVLNPTKLRHLSGVDAPFSAHTTP